MNEYTPNLTSVCLLNDNQQILLLDNYTNSVSIFDKNFNLIKSVCLNDFDHVRQSHMTFNSNLYGIVASSKYVYINSMDRNEIIVLDKELESIKTIFQPLRVKSIFEVEVSGDFVYVFDNRNREVFRYDQQGVLIDTIKLESTSLEKYAEKMSEIENSEKFANISNSFAISDRSEFIACFRPFIGEINVHKFDGSIYQVIENVFDRKTSLSFMSNYLWAYNGSSGSILFFEKRDKERSDCVCGSYFDLVGKITKTKLINEQEYSFISCHKKILFFNNRLFVLFSENNCFGYIQC